MSVDDPKYIMKISRLTIDKLGIQMYDRVSAVLAEMIANAYDADATEVTISLPFGQMLVKREKGQDIDQEFEITIKDNGSGMTEQEVNDFYLNVGYDRRKTRGDRTGLFDRRVMGRKGIGKLAPFGICREVEVISASKGSSGNGYLISNLILDLDKMLEEQTDELGNVLPYPPDVGPRDGEVADSPGTTLILRNFDRKRVPDRENLHRQLTARFGIGQKNWNVRLEDSAGEKASFELGKLPMESLSDTRIEVNERPVKVADRWLPVSGWVAYAKDAYKDEVMAGVRIFARGKIVAQTRDFDIGAGFTGEFKMRSYLMGAVAAEWLDEDEDLIQTDRQDIIWNSEKGNSLREWGQDLIRELAAKAEKSKKERTWDIFLEKSRFSERLRVVHPENKDKPLRDAVWKAARVLVADADRDSIEDPNYIKRLIRLAYAIGPHHALLALLDEIAASSDGSKDTILNLFETASMVEMYSLGQVAYERVRVIEKLRQLISDHSTEERDLQKLIQDASWILYPDWTPLSKNQTLASTRQNFESWYLRKYRCKITTSVIGDSKKRADFVMLNHAGRLEIVEIKRPKNSLTNDEFRTAHRYLSVIKDFIEDTDEVRRLFPDARLTIVCNDLNLDHLSSAHLTEASNIVHKTWHDLFASSRRSHEDFLGVVERFQGDLPEIREERE